MYNQKVPVDFGTLGVHLSRVMVTFEHVMDGVPN